MIGEPYVMKCPQCGNLILANVILGSCCCSCDKCSPKEFIRFDFILKEALKENQNKYRDFINENRLEME
jgi:DNA-directed RNA polymerase subunit M/transcription elongation factor TFIIS